MGLFSFLSKGEKTMQTTMLEHDVKMLKKENEELKRRLDRDEQYIEKTITQLDRLVDIVKTMMERR